MANRQRIKSLRKTEALSAYSSSSDTPLSTKQLIILDTNNYHRWATRKKLQLMKDELWQYVEKEMLTERASDEIKSKINRTKAEILLSISERLQGQVEHMDSPHKIWQTLAKPHNSKSDQRNDSLLRQFQNLKMKEVVMTSLNI